MTYEYEAIPVEPGLWMVRRYDAGDQQRYWKESLIGGDSAEAAIKTAVERNSWN